MKKILLMMAVATFTLLTGCSKDDGERTSQTIFVNIVDSDGALVTLNPENSAVFFFEDNGKAIDYSKSRPSYNGGMLTYTDGTFSTKAKIMDSDKPAIYTFENVPNGKYILWVHYYPYSTGTNSSKKFIVNENSHLKIEEKTFKSGLMYEEW